MTFVSTNLFAEATKVPLREVQRAFKKAANGQTWRGHSLPVVQVPSQRGGKGGMTWALDLSQASDDLFLEFPTLKTFSVPATVPTEKPLGAGVAQWQLKEQRDRAEILKKALGSVPGSRDRGNLLREIEADWHLYKGERRQFDFKTLQRWLLAYDANGLAGLLPKPNGNPGQPRVLISRPWDKGIDLAEDTKDRIANELAEYCRSLIAKATSGRRTQSLAAKKLVLLCLASGSKIPPKDLKLICKINAKYIERFKAFKRVARHDLDNKKFFDKDVPRIARRRSDRPGQVVWGDAHPVDIYMQDPNAKGQLRLRLIAWMDDYSRYLWVTVAVFGQGHGVRQPDIADSLFNLVSDPIGGLPETLYLDNGGEYSALQSAMQEIPDAIDFLHQRGVVLAQPYNGPAKGAVENGFSILEKGFFKHIQGYIGGDRTNKKTHAVGKPVKGFDGTIDDLVNKINDLVAAYNDDPQGGEMNGQSPREAMQDAINQGWQSVGLDVDAFDFAFSRRETRTVKQGKFHFNNIGWRSDSVAGLGAGDKVDIRIPLRSAAEGVFVIHEGERLHGRAYPENKYHPLDRDGAREKNRLGKIQKASIRDLKKQVNPNIDPAEEILAGVNTTPIEAPTQTIIRLGDAVPEREEHDDAAARALAEDFLGGLAPRKRRTGEA